MEETRLGRRRFLAAAGAGFVGSLAGCATPRSGPSFETDAEPIDRDDRADGSTYTDVYERTIDSVTLVRVFGVDDPTGGQTRGQGSAFVYDASHVVTNDHVVYGSDQIELQYPNGDWSTAAVVGTDYYSDLAVLEVEHVPDAATPLEFSQQSPVVGQEVLAIGNPYGLEGSMSKGIVSGVDRALQVPQRDFAFPNVVQTDAAVNPGNSGGPLVGLDGTVVGVINAGGGDNIGFAISAALASRVVPALVDDGVYRHSYMGIGLRTVDPLIARENNLPRATGVIVTDVPEDGPADGVLRGRDEIVRRNGAAIPVGGDVILAIDGEPIPDRHALSTYLALETSPDETISIELRRDRRIETVDLTLGARPLVD